MATKLTPGDVVRLNVPCMPIEVTDEDKATHHVAEQLSEHQAASSKAKPPWMLFGSVTGIYLGHTRLKIRDKRASRGVIRHYYHKFMFGTHEVMIEHHNVDVFISYEQLLKSAADDD